MKALLDELREAKIKVAALESQLWQAILSNQAFSQSSQVEPSKQESLGVPEGYPQDGTWRSKILFILGEGKSEGRGQLRGEILRKLNLRHVGRWIEPAIDAQLAHMEREGKVRIQRMNGRNTYFLA
jgi:hypothetical protein